MKINFCTQLSFLNKPQLVLLNYNVFTTCQREWCQRESSKLKKNIVTRLWKKLIFRVLQLCLFVCFLVIINTVKLRKHAHFEKLTCRMLSYRVQRKSVLQLAVRASCISTRIINFLTSPPKFWSSKFPEKLHLPIREVKNWIY